MLEERFMGFQSCLACSTFETWIGFFLLFLCAIVALKTMFWDNHFLLSRGHALILGQLHVFMTGAWGFARSFAFLANITEIMLGFRL